MSYINSKENIDCKLTTISNNIIQVNGLPQITNGFTFYLDNNVEVGHYEDYTTVYRVIDKNTIQYSNNESIYIEPKPIVYSPTEEELVQILNNNKLSLIVQSKQLLATYISEHPLISTCHNNTSGIYSVTSEKQSLMTSNYLSYTISKQLGLDAQLTWNESGKECEVWTEIEFLTLIAETTAYIKPLVKKQQDYEVAINNCTTVEELEAIVIEY